MENTPFLRFQRRGDPSCCGHCRGLERMKFFPLERKKRGVFRLVRSAANTKGRGIGKEPGMVGQEGKKELDERREGRSSVGGKGTKRHRPFGTGRVPIRPGLGLVADFVDRGNA